MGGNQNLHSFFQMLGSAFLQNGWVFNCFSKPRFFEKNSGNLSSKCETLPGVSNQGLSFTLGVPFPP